MTKDEYISDSAPYGREFIVSTVTYGDIVSHFEDDEDVTEEQIESLTDDEMKKIARMMNDGLTESGAYWDALESATEYIIKERN